jgi:hypothetical protein
MIHTRLHLLSEDVIIGRGKKAMPFVLLTSFAGKKTFILFLIRSQAEENISGGIFTCSHFMFNNTFGTIITAL